MKHLADTNLLQISVTPTTVYVSTNPDQSGYANIVVTVINSSSAPVTLKSIAITLPPTLTPTATLGGITPVPPDGWNLTPSMFSAGEFDGHPGSAKDAVLAAAGGKLVFTIPMIMLINPIIQPTAEVPVTLTFGDGSVFTQSPAIQLAPAVATITSFNSLISDIKPGETATLTWVCAGIDYCIISAIDGTHLPSSSNVNVSPPATTSYTLYAYGDDVILSAQWGITVENPLVTTFGQQNGLTSINYGDNITLVWACNQYVKNIILTNDQDVNIPTLISGTNTPEGGSITVGPITTTTNFTFIGFAGNPQNYNSAVSVISVNDVTCKISASPDTGTWEKDVVTLTWDIQSATAVSISPAVDNGPSLQNLSGSVEVYPTENVTYTITATGLKASVPGNTATCNAQLAVTPVTITDFGILPTQIVAAQGGVNAAVLSWITQSQTLSLSNGLGNVMGQTSYALTAPADQTQYVLSAGTLQNPGMYASVVTVQNGWGPFNGTITPGDLLNIPIPAGPYQAFAQAELDNTAIFPMPAYCQNIMPQTYYILEIDGITGDNDAATIGASFPTLAAQLTTGRYLAYLLEDSSTIYGQPVFVACFVVIVKFDPIAAYPATVKIVTITPAFT